MCTVVDRFMEKGRIAGREEGRIAGREEGRIAGMMEGMIETCQELGLSKEATIERVEDKFSLPKEAAAEHVEKNWK